MGKIYISGRNQTKTVTPSNIQQTIEADIGYNSLDSVVVNPIKAAMPQTLEQFIMRDDNMEPFSLNLDGDVPMFACFQQKNLVAVYGAITSIARQAFSGCLSLESINLKNVTSISSANSQSAFDGCIFQNVDVRNLNVLNDATFSGCNQLKYVDIRNIANIRTNVFSSTELLLIDITNSHSATLSSANSIPSRANNLVILAADATDKAYYQSATNWSTHASKIKTVAEFEQQIGMSYDDYYEIIFGHPRFDNQEATS